MLGLANKCIMAFEFDFKVFVVLVQKRPQGEAFFPMISYQVCKVINQMLVNTSEQAKHSI